MYNAPEICGEDEVFIKLNGEIDLETKGLLQQLDDMTVVKEDREITNSATSLTQRPKIERQEKAMGIPNIGSNIAASTKLVRHKSEVRGRDRLDVSSIPDSVKNMGHDGVVRFLKAKLEVVTEQLENVQKDERKAIEKVKELQNDRERVSEDRDKWIQQATSAKNLLTKHEQHVGDIVIQLQSTLAENAFLKKEVEKLKKELKQVNQTASSNEVRLNRANDEVEKLKASLRQAKQEERDIRDGLKRKVDDLTAVLKTLEKQKVELLHAFKKQLVVIDGLKKQKSLGDTGKLLKTIEDDFLEFLDWTPNKK